LVFKCESCANETKQLNRILARPLLRRFFERILLEVCSLSQAV
jgi:hypothetical protein